MRERVKRHRRPTHRRNRSLRHKLLHRHRRCNKDGDPKRGDLKIVPPRIVRLKRVHPKDDPLQHNHRRPKAHAKAGLPASAKAKRPDSAKDNGKVADKVAATRAAVKADRIAIANNFVAIVITRIVSFNSAARIV